jgi:hypothetical protein
MPFLFPRIIKAAALALAAALGWPTGTNMAYTANASRAETVRYPWDGTGDEIAVNLAIGSLRDSLMQWLTTERGVHAETLLVSIGAVAGFAAQAAALERMNKRDVPLPAGFDKTVSREAFNTYLRDAGLILIGSTKEGQHFYFGDLINGYLVQQKTTVGHSLFAILAAAAIEAGARPSELPDMAALFRHVASTVGKPEYGVLNPPKPLNPHYTPRAALTEFWPGVRFIFQRTDGQGIVDGIRGQNVKAEYWPLITALVARQLLLLTRDTIEPRVALALMMESAIVTSKLDPKTVPQQRPNNAPPQPPQN